MPDLLSDLFDKPAASRLPDLIAFARENKLTVGSTTGGRHNVGSRHYSGNAIDIKNSGNLTDEQVAQLSRAASTRGFLLRDERKRPPGQKVWGGPHIHLENPLVRQETAIQDPLVDLFDSKVSEQNPPPEKAADTPKTGQPSAPSIPLTTNDAAWHFGLSLKEAQRLGPKAQRVLTEAVAEDQRKRAAGQEIQPPSLEYQNQMRRRIGLKALRAPLPDVVEAGPGGSVDVDLNTMQPLRRASPAMQARTPSLWEQLKEKAAPYVPGLASLDTPGGIKTDVARGLVSGVTLGYAGDPRQVSREEQILDPEAQTKANVAHTVGEYGSAFLPYVGAEKLVGGAIKGTNLLSRAARTGAVFGGVEAARQGVNAIRGRETNLKQVPASVGVGALSGGLMGRDPGVLRRVGSLVGPQAAKEVIEGAPPEQIATSAVTNTLFGLMGGKKLEDGLVETASKTEPLRREVAVKPPPSPTMLGERIASEPVTRKTEAPTETAPPAERPIETAIRTRASQQDRLDVLRGELAQWQRAGGKSQKGQARIRALQQEIAKVEGEVSRSDAEAAQKLATERQSEIEATRYSSTPRFDEWAENRSGQRLDQLSESKVGELRKEYRQQFADAPAPPLLREMPPLPTHHSQYQPRRVRGEGKGQFKKGKPQIPEASPEQTLSGEVEFLRDESGQPLTVYHQTTKEAEQAIRASGFDLSKARARRSDEGVPDGVFFKPNKGSIFTDLSDTDSAELAANLRIRAPLEVGTREELVEWARRNDPEYAKLADKVQSYDRQRAYENREKTNEYENLISDATAARARLTQALRREGYDGVVIERDAGGPQVTKTYVALDPKQVKLLEPETRLAPAEEAVKQPLGEVVYHAGDVPFEKMDISKIMVGTKGRGLYFATTAEGTHPYELAKRDRVDPKNIRAARLEMRNPADLTSEAGLSQLADEMHALASKPDSPQFQEALRLTETLGRPLTSENLQLILRNNADAIRTAPNQQYAREILEHQPNLTAISKALGYDGIIGAKEHVVFDRSQIKSVSSGGTNAETIRSNQEVIQETAPIGEREGSEVPRRENLRLQREQPVDQVAESKVLTRRQAEPEKTEAQVAEPTPQQTKEIEQRFQRQIESDPAKAERDYRERFTQNGVLVLNTDNARELSPDYSASLESRAMLSSAVHEPASSLVKDIFKRELTKPPERGRDVVVFTGGGTGAGKTRTIENLPLTDDAGLIFDTNLNSFASADSKIQQTLKAGRRVVVAAVYRDPVVALTEGALPRAEKIGRTVPLTSHAETHVGFADAIPKLASKYKDDPRVKVLIIDNTGAKGEQRLGSLDLVKPQDYNSLLQRLKDATEAEYKAGRISERTYKGSLIGSLGADSGGQPQAQPLERGRQTAKARIEPPLTRAALTVRPFTSTPPEIVFPKTGQLERSFPKSAEAAGLPGGENLKYDPITNEESLAKADKRIKQIGVDRAVGEIARRKEASADDVATGIRLMQTFTQAGQHERAADVAGDLAQKLTQAGQSVQAASIISRLSPEGVLLTAQRQLPTGKKLTAAQSEALVGKAKTVQEADARIADLEKQIAEMQANVSEKKPTKPKLVEKIGTLEDRLVKLESEARARLEARKQEAKKLGPQAGASAIPLDIADYAIVGAAKIARKGMSTAKWTAEMVSEFGEDIRPHLQKIYRESYSFYEEHRKQMQAESQERSIRRETPGPQRPEDLNRLIENRAAARKDARTARAEMARLFNDLTATPWTRTKAVVGDVLNVPRTLKSSLDLSAPRQGAMWILNHPIEGTKTFFGKQIKAMREVNYDKFVDELESDPDYALMTRSGLALTTTDSRVNALTAREEAFMSRLAGKVPGVKHSERAYTTFLDTARSSWFKQLKNVAELKAQSENRQITPEEYQAIANFVNIATGRGNLGKGTLNNVSPFLNAVFFAPKFAVSKVQIFDPRVYARMPKGARTQAMREAVTYFGAITTAAMLLKYGLKQTVGTDPEESEFMKLRIGNTRYDLANGTGQYVTLAARLLRNAENKRTGKKEKFGHSLQENLDRFLRYKYSPPAAMARNTWEGKNAIGEKTNLKKESIEAIMPLFANDLYDAYKQEGLTGLAKTSPGFVGVGVNTYGDKKKK